ncbi:hypothetical protein MTO96_023148 [Rhipicephalus appendiculatus]
MCGCQVGDVRGFEADDDFRATFCSVKWIAKDGETQFYRARILLVGATSQASASQTSATSQASAAAQTPQPEQSEQEPELPDTADIRSGLKISTSAWWRIQSDPKDSTFVKDLLTAVWSPADLLGRSLQGNCQL